MNSSSEPYQVPLDLSAYIGKQITLAITDHHAHGGKPEISLLIGVLKQTGSDYTIVANSGNVFQIPKEWHAKVKLIGDGVKQLLGGSDLLLSITKAEFETMGFTYHRDPRGSIDIQVVP
jgi:hypothetical protein